MPRRRSRQGSPPPARACAASASLLVLSELVGWEARPVSKAEGGSSRRRPPPPICDDPKRLRRLLAVGLVATAAILAHLGDLDLEAIEILGRVPGRLGLAGELGELGGEISLGLPNRG